MFTHLLISTQILQFEKAFWSCIHTKKIFHCSFVINFKMSNNMCNLPFVCCERLPVLLVCYAKSSVWEAHGMTNG